MNIVPLSRAEDGRQKIAVVGSGIAEGASAGGRCPSSADVTPLRGASGRAGGGPGGHTPRSISNYDGRSVPVDTGFIVYNELNYPDLTRLFAHLGVRRTKAAWVLACRSTKAAWNGAASPTGRFSPSRATPSRHPSCACCRR